MDEMEVNESKKKNEEKEAGQRRNGSLWSGIRSGGNSSPSKSLLSHFIFYKRRTV